MTNPTTPATPFLADAETAPVVSPAQRVELVFVVSNVSDLDFLLGNIAPGTEVHVLDAAGDGLAQMAQILAGRSGIDAIHLVTHGAQGTIALGSTNVSAQNLAGHGADLAAIGAALGADGDILLYGCDAGAGDEGAALLAGLAQATGADVAASDDLTGAIARGGDWVLERESGAIESASLGATGALDGYAGLLTPGTTFSFTDSVVADDSIADADELQTVTQLVGGDTLTITANAGGVVVMDNQFFLGLSADLTNFTGNVFATNTDNATAPSSLTLALDSGKTFDLSSLNIVNSAGENIDLILSTSKGTVPVTVAFSSESAIVKGFSDPILQGVTSVEITKSGGGQFYLMIDEIVLANITAAAVAPTTTVSNAALSSDTGSSATDFVTNVASQTIDGTLSANLATGESVEVSYNNGNSWSTATATVGSSAWSASTTLAGSGVFQARVTNSSGSSAAYSHSYTLDTVAPSAPTTPDLATASDSGGNTGDNVTFDTTPTFTTTASTGDQTVTFYDTDGVTVLASGYSATAAHELTAAAMSAGVHTITAKASDLAGNVSAASAGLNVTVDPTGPTLAITSNVASLKAGETATITFTFTEDPGSTFAWDGSSGDIVVTGGTLGAISGSGLTRTATFTPTASTDGGSASITVASGSYTDAAGNDGGAGSTPSLSFDTLAPNAPSVPDMSAGSDNGTSSSDDITNAGTPLTFTGTADSGSTVTLYDTDGTTMLGTGIATGGAWSITSSTVSAGAHTVTAKAADAAGNISTASAGLSVTVDATAPSITFSGVALSNDTGYSSTDFNTNMAAQTVSGILSGTLAGGDTAWGSVDAGASWVDITGKVSGTALTWDGVTLAGSTYLKFKIVDSAGNDGTIASNFYQLDTTAPSAPSAPNMSSGSDLGVSNADDITSDTTPTFTGNVYSSVRTAILYDSDGVTELGTALTKKSYTVTATPMSEGTHTVYARVVDFAGNMSALSSGSTVTIDATAPTLAITSDVAHVKIGETAAITFTFTEDPGSTFAWDGASGDIVVTGGTLGAISGSELTRTATFTPTAGTDGGSASITVASASYTDAAGNSGGAGATPSLTFGTLAPAAPSAPDLAGGSDAGTSSTDDLTSVTTPTFTGTAESGSTVTLYDTDGTTVLGTGAATGGDWSITSSTLSAGAHTVSATATDADGNVSAASSGLSVTIDTTAPTLAITSNVEQLKIGQTATITFTFTEDPGSTFAWDGSTGDIVVTGGTLSAIEGSGLTRTATFTPTASTDGGSASITVASGSYTDAAGNDGGAGSTPSLTFDTLAPDAPSTPDMAGGSDSGTSIADDITNATTPTFTGTAESGSTVTLYDTDGTTVLGTGTATGGAWSITSSTLSAGAHTVSATATDAAGNVSAASSGLSVTVDTTAPTLAITSNVAQLKIGETATITFTFTEDPGSTFAWNGSSGDIVVTGGTLGAISGSGLTRTATFTPTASTDGGSASITVAAGSYTDAAGNDGGAGSTPSLTFDTLAPDAPSVPNMSGGSDSGTSIADDITNATTPTFTGTAESGSTVTLYDTDGTTVLGTGIATGGNWSITSSALSAGAHTVTATATDAAGNVSAASSGLSVTIDTTAPTLAITSNVAQLKIGETATITFTFTEAPGSTFAWNGSSGDIVVTGGTLSAISGSGLTRTATFTPTASTDGGSASITVASGSYTDAAGNEGGAGSTPSLSFDTLAPDAPSAPDLASDSGTSSADDITNATTPTFTGTAESGSTVTLYDTDGTTVLGTGIATGGNWSITSTTLTAGAHTVTAMATDAAGNVSAASSGLSVTIDTTAPTLAITSNVEQLKIGETATITFTFTEDPGSTFAWNGSSGDIVVTGGTLGAISGSGLTRTATFTPTASTNGGSASITVAAGSYTDAAGNEGGAGSTPSLTFDTLAPNAPSAPDLASDSGTSSADDITNATTPTFTGTAESGSTVTLYDTDGTTVLGTGTATGGNWSITSSTLSAGAHTVTATATDAAGNVSAASSGLSVTVDTTAPTLAITSNVEQLKIGETATITFTFTENPGSTFAWNGSSGDIVVTGGTLGAISGSGLTRTATFTPTASTNGGSASITVASGSYTDAAGNEGGAGSTPSLTFDTLAPNAPSAPELASDSGTSSTDDITNATTPTLTGTAESGSTVTLYDTDGTTVLGTGTATGGAWSITSSALSAGAHTVTATATDAAGNVSSASSGLSVTIDTTAPTLAITSNVAQLKIGETATITFTFSEDPGSTFAWDGTSGDIVVTGGTLGAISGSGLTRTATFTPTASTDGGSASITVAAGSYTDAAGNEGGAGSTPSLSFDTLAPDAPSAPNMSGGSDSGTSIADDITNATTPTFTGTAESGSTVTLYDTDGTTVLGTGTATGGAWSITSSTLSAGAHTVSATATDAAGNVSAASSGVSVTVDTTAPTLAITSNVAQLKIGETATITFTFSEDPGSTFAWDGSSGDVVVTGGTLGTISGSGLTRTATFTPTASTDGGSASITVAAGSYTDAAGNDGGAGSTPSLSFDTLAPNAPSAPDLASDSGTSSTDDITNATTPTFTGTAESGSTVTLYDTDGTTVLGTGTATGGDWSITSSTLSAGAHTINAKATDAAGNVSVVSAGLTVTIDTTAPTLAIDSNVAQLKIGETATITFTFSEDPGSTFAWGDIVVSGGTLGTISGSGLTRTATFTPTASTNGGSASITVASAIYTDAAGNSGGAGSTPSLTFDTLAPDAPSAPNLVSDSDTGSSNSDNVTRRATPIFNGTAESGSTVTLYDTDGTTVLGTAVAAGGNWSIGSISLTKGAHSITAVATDGFNNIGGASAASDIVIDRTAPAGPALSLALDSGSSNTDRITNNGTVNVTGVEAGASWEYSIDGGASWVAGSGTSFTVSGDGAKSAIARQTDLAGNVSGDTGPFGFTLDTAAAGGAAIAIDDSALKAGEASLVTVRFSSQVTGLDNGDFSVANGILGALSTSDNGVTWTAMFTPFANVTAASNVITLTNAGVTNAAGTPGTGTTSSNNFAIDTRLPAASIVVASTSLAGGQSSAVTITFSEPVTGLTIGDLSVDNGTLSGLGSADGGTTWSATLTPAAGIVDASNVITLSNAAVTDAAGNASLGTVSSNNYAVSTAGLVASIAVADATLLAGASTTVTITFSQPVTGFSNANLALANASLNALSSSNGGLTWSATLTPSANVVDASNVVTLNFGTVSAVSNNYALNTVRPTATISVDDSALVAGASTQVTVAFSEAVSGFTNADLSVDNATLGALSSADGGITWTATLTPTANLSASSNFIRLQGEGVHNAAGNTGLGTVVSNDYAIATVPAVRATVDGVATLTQVIANDTTGLVNQIVTIPVIVTTRSDDPASQNSTLADIPLGIAAPEGAPQTVLVVSLPTGTGLQVDGATTLLSNTQALLDLVTRIQNKTETDSAVQGEMTGQGAGFLSGLSADVMLETKTLVPTIQPGTSLSTPIIITGSSSTPPAGTSNSTAIGLVIDTTALPGGSVLQLNNVDFAAIVGGATLRGGEGRNFVVGDDAVQNILLGAEDDVISGGAGNDIIGSAGGDDLLDGGTGEDIVVGGIGNDTLRGGSGNDTVQGGRSDQGEWQFFLTNTGSLLAQHGTAVFGPGQTETVQLLEMNRAASALSFLGANTEQLADISLLYHAVFQRAPDLAGIAYWARDGVAIKDVASLLLSSSEWIALGNAELTDTAFLQRLYMNVLGREADADSITYWAAKLAGGAEAPAVSRADVLIDIALSGEHRQVWHTAQGYAIGTGALTQEAGWFAASGDDRLDGGLGSDIMVGGDGFDTVVYSGAQADYKFIIGADGQFKIGDKANGDLDVLSGIEAGEFKDGTVDLTWMQSKTASMQQLGLLYQTVFDRAGDAAGYQWWMGLDLDGAQLAQALTETLEFKGRYGDMSDAAFIGALFDNAGLDGTAAGGMQVWNDYLATRTRAELIATWVGVEGVVDAQFGTQGLWLI